MTRTEIDTPDILVVRDMTAGKHSLSLLPRIYVEPGTREDWELLHELHYKAEELGIGPKFFRCAMDGETIGVGVFTVGKMLSAGRNEVFTYLRPNVGGMDSRLINRHRALWINNNSCTNSRLVLDTMYRGAGIAYRMQNLMMRMTGKRVIEFQSSMSKFNPFAARAGVKFGKPRRSANYDRGVPLFRRWFQSVPSDYVGIMAEIDAMTPAVRAKCLAELRKFYFTFSSLERSGNNRFHGASRVEGLETGYLLKQLQQLVLASPLYGVYINPDHGRDLPTRIPLLAFDNQPVDEPLRLDKL